MTGVLSVLALASVACTGERDTPEPPETDLKANITIKELIGRYKGQAFAAIDTALYIEGVVTANDISGNIYKKIFLQDSTAGIDIEIEMTNNHQKYPIGQRLVIDLKGLAFGTYHGQPQIGAQGENVTERLYEPQCDEHFHRKGYASQANMPEPIVLTVHDVNFTVKKASYLGMLIRIDSVRFDSAGCIYVDQISASTTGNAMNREIIDKNGTNKLAVRISAYALFAPDTIPHGYGTVQGILSIYGDNDPNAFEKEDLQLFPRMKEDIFGFPNKSLQESSSQENPENE